MTGPAAQCPQGDDPGDRTASLRSRAIQGTAWMIVGQVGQHGLRFASNLILTRLLVTSDFGLMLAVTVFLQGLAMFSDIGINAAIIQHPRGDDPKFLDTAWTVQVLRGLLLSLLCLVLSGPYAAFVGKPIGTLLPVAGIALLFEGLGSTALATLNRHLSMRRLMLFQLRIQLAATVFTVCYAFVFRSVWALVAGALFASCLRMVLGHLLFPERRSRFAWHREHLATLVGFGLWIFLNTLLGFAADQTDKVVFSRLLSEDDAGRYAIAVLIAGMPYLLMVQFGSAIAFPLFGRARDEGLDIAMVMHRVKFATLVPGGLCASALLAACPSLVEFLYPEDYWAAGWMVLPVTAGQWFRILCLAPANALFALGRLSWLFGANIFRMLGYAIFVAIGWSTAALPGALVGFAAGEVFGAAVYAVGCIRHRLGWPRVDAGFTLLLAASAAAGYGLREEALRLGAGRPLAILLGVALAALPWLLLGRRLLTMARGIKEVQARR